MKPIQAAYGIGIGLSSLGLWSSLLSQPAQSHGTQIDYQITPSVNVVAQYESGDAMSQAQVAVFAPDDPQTPWETGLTDATGRFQFSPAPRQSGNWEVQVRQAGHGSVITIPIAANGTVEPTTQGGLTLAHKLLMTGLGLWGFLGTGLYFSNRPRAQPRPVPEQTVAEV